MLYGATDIKGTSGVEYVQHWSNVCDVTVVQIMNHFASGFTALETDPGDRMVCLSDGLRLILCCFFCFCALSPSLVSDLGNARHSCTLGPHHIDLHTTAVSIEIIFILDVLGD